MRKLLIQTISLLYLKRVIACSPRFTSTPNISSV